MTEFSMIEAAARTIIESEKTRNKLVKELAPLRKQSLPSSSELLESSLIFKLTKAVLNQKIAAADSGFLGKNLHALDLVVIRTAGIVLSYQDSKVQVCEYLPSFYPFPKIVILNDP